MQNALVHGEGAGIEYPLEEHFSTFAAYENNLENFKKP